MADANSKSTSSLQNIINGEVMQTISIEEEGKVSSEEERKFADLNDDNEFIKPCGGFVGEAIEKCRHFFKKNKLFGFKKNTYYKKLVVMLVALVYMTYVLVKWTKSDCRYTDWANGYGLALILFIIFVIFYAYKVLTMLSIKYMLGQSLSSSLVYIKHIVRYGYYLLQMCVVLLYVWEAIIAGTDEKRRLISICGYFVILFFGLIFSKHPRYINWRTVSSGLVLQLTLGLVLVRLDLGRAIVMVIGDKAEKFLSFGYVGARFVYGDFLIDNMIFAFKIIPVLFFMAMIVNIVFYLGWLQAFCLKLGSFIHLLVGTSIVESVNAVASIFLGMTESPLLFRPYLQHLTPSEMHAVMGAGFATVAGTVLAAYISFGAEPSNLVTASVMAAPAALAFSKLFYPERRKSKTSINNIIMVKSEDIGVIDAACKGASSATELINGIIANVVALVSFLALLNALTTWLGMLAGVSDLTIEKIVGGIFIPLAWVMGVEPSECSDVARLIGTKTVINEFVAFKELGILKEAKKLSPRSEAIATFALCGFANPGSVAILIAILTSMCPSQRETITKSALRSFITGSCTSFLSACIAGLLTPENGFSITADSSEERTQFLFSNNSFC